MTYNDSTKVAELFINGASQGTRTLASGYSGGGGTLNLSSTPGSSPWNGYMQEFVVFENIVSAANILAIYNAGLGGVG